MSGQSVHPVAIEREAHRIFRRALDEAPERRHAFVHAACGDQAELRAIVVALVASMSDAEEFLETPAVSALGGVLPAAREGEASLIGERVGKYLVTEKLATGGMGVVYLAEQENPRRTVALKVMRSGLASARARRLFAHEAQVLGRLQHPNVARIHEAATHAHGPLAAPLPYFAMEYVAGAVPLTTYAETHRLDTAERIALFRKACLGVLHGHQKGIVHRDLKPANIIVDGAGEPRVIDYGVALVTAGDAGATLAQTDAGQLVGTLKYMSPEQCRGDVQRIDTRSDIYALGVVLYELLCGRFPHELENVSPLAIPRMITEATPIRPRAARPDLPRALETIILTAIAKDPDDRYQSVADLERDLGRYLRHEPIDAEPPSAGYLLRLFVRRHRTLIAAGLFAAIAALGATTISVIFAVTAREAEQRATVQRDRALVRQYFADLAAAESALRAKEFRRLRTHLDSAPPALRGWEWNYMHEQADPSLVVVEHPAIVDAVVTMNDDEHFLVGGRSGRIEMRKLATGALVRATQTQSPLILGLAISRDGSCVAATNESGTIELFDLPSLQRRWRSSSGHGDRGLSGDARAVTISPDGGTVVSAGRDGSVRAWDARDGTARWVSERPGEPSARQAISVAHHPSQPIVATGGTDGLIDFWDAESGFPIRRLEGHPDAQVLALVFSLDGMQLYSGANDRTVAVWSLETGRRIRTLLGHDRSVWSLALRKDGAVLASASIDHTIRTWSAEDGAPLETLYGHGDAVANVAFSPSGQRLVTASWDRTSRVWDAAPRDDTLPVHVPLETIDAIAFSPDGRLLATAHSGESSGGGAGVLLRDALTLDTIGTIARAGTRSRSVEFAPNADAVAIAWMDGAVTVIDTRTGAERLSLNADDGPTMALCITPDQQWLVTGHQGSTVRIWSLSTGALEEEFECASPAVGRLAISPDGSRLVTVPRGRMAQLWDLSGLRAGARSPVTAIATLGGHLEAIFAVAISPDGRSVLTGSRDQTIRVWNSSDGALERVLDGHGQWVTGLAYTPDGSRLVSASRFDTLTLWDAERLEPIVTLRGHERPIRALAIEPSGDRIITGDDVGSIRVWDRRARSMRKQLALRASEAAANAESIVAARLESATPDEVAQTIGTDSSLDESTRRALFNALLRRGLAE